MSDEFEMHDMLWAGAEDLNELFELHEEAAQAAAEAARLQKKAEIDGVDSRGRMGDLDVPMEVHYAAQEVPATGVFGRDEFQGEFERVEVLMPLQCAPHSVHSVDVRGDGLREAFESEGLTPDALGGSQPALGHKPSAGLLPILSLPPTPGVSDWPVTSSGEDPTPNASPRLLRRRELKRLQAQRYRAAHAEEVERGERRVAELRRQLAELEQENLDLQLRSTVLANSLQRFQAMYNKLAAWQETTKQPIRLPSGFDCYPAQMSTPPPLKVPTATTVGPASKLPSVPISHPAPSVLPSDLVNLPNPIYNAATHNTTEAGDAPFVPSSTLPSPASIQFPYSQVSPSPLWGNTIPSLAPANSWTPAGSSHARENTSSSNRQLNAEMAQSGRPDTSRMGEGQSSEYWHARSLPDTSLPASNIEAAQHQPLGGIHGSTVGAGTGVPPCERERGTTAGTSTSSTSARMESPNAGVDPLPSDPIDAEMSERLEAFKHKTPAVIATEWTQFVVDAAAVLSKYEQGDPTAMGGLQHVYEQPAKYCLDCAASNMHLLSYCWSLNLQTVEVQVPPLSHWRNVVEALNLSQKQIQQAVLAYGWISAQYEGIPHQAAEICEQLDQLTANDATPSTRLPGFPQSQRNSRNKSSNTPCSEDLHEQLLMITCKYKTCINLSKVAIFSRIMDKVQGTKALVYSYPFMPDATALLIAAAEKGWMQERAQALHGHGARLL